MRHWYVVFPAGVSATAARRMLKRWGAKPESDQPPIPLDGGEEVDPDGAQNWLAEHSPNLRAAIAASGRTPS